MPGLDLRVGSMGDAEAGALPRPARRVPGAPRDALDEEALAHARQPAAPLRLQGPGGGGHARRPDAARPPVAGRPGHRAAVLGALDRLGIAYEEDPTLVRGFDYYTMTVFEFTSDRLGAQSAVGGGVRRAGRGARRAADPGIGFGAGVERIVLAIQDEDGAETAALDCYLAVPDEGLRAEGLAWSSACGHRACAASGTCAGAA